jgi:hypothetical protein
MSSAVYRWRYGKLAIAGWSLVFLLVGSQGSGARLLAQEAKSSPHLTSSQASEIRRLVTRTHSDQARIKEALAAAHEKLAQCYDSYELDERQIEATHRAISELEQELFRTHLAMHRELRKIISAEVFAGIAQRVRQYMDKQIRNSEDPGRATR